MQRLTYFALCLLTWFLVVVFNGSCVNHDLNEIDPCAQTNYSYAFDVDTIVRAKCAISGCHNGSLGPDRNWTVFTTFQEKALSGDVSAMVESHRMPPDTSQAGPLTEEQIFIISCWATNGAAKN
jgi:hypothetical protein